MLSAVRCAVYGRLSKDADGSGVAVDRQLQDCRDLAARRGWEVVEEFRDDSRSAWRRDVRRPGWEAMLEGIKHDRFDAVVVWHGDRLMRQPFDLERLISLVEDKGLKVASPAGERDLGKADDRFVIRIEVAAQCRESDGTARRVRRVMHESAEQGRRHGIVPFGWRSPAEADAVRRIVRGLLAGDSLMSITNEFNAQGVPSPGGKRWTGTITRQVAQRWSNAGKRVHRDVVVGEGRWEALVTQSEQEAVLRLLADPARRTNAGTHRRHLLSGIAVCAVCGSKMRGVHMHRRQRTYRIYRCMDGMCVSVGADWLDGAVLALAQARIAGVEPDTGDEASQARAELAALAARKERAALDYAEGAFDAAQLRVINKTLDGRISEASSRLAAHERRERVDAATVLADLGPERQRAVLKVLFDRIEVRRANARHDLDRIVPVWSA